MVVVDTADILPQALLFPFSFRNNRSRWGKTGRPNTIQRNIND